MVKARYQAVENSKKGLSTMIQTDCLARDYDKQLRLWAHLSNRGKDVLV